MAKNKLQKTPKRKLTFQKFLFGLVVFLVLLFAFFIAQFAIYYNDRIYPGVKIAGIDMSKKTRGEAANLLKNTIIVPENIEVKAKEKVFDLSLGGIEFSYDFEKSVDNAFLVNKDRSFLYDFFEQLSPIQKETLVSLETNININKLDEYLQVISSQVATEPVLPSVSFDTGIAKIENGSPGETVDLLKFQNDLEENLANYELSPIFIQFISDNTVLTEKEIETVGKRAQNLIGKKIVLKNEFDIFNLTEKLYFPFLDGKGSYYEDLILNYLVKEVEPKVNREPQNAVFRFESGKVIEFKPAKNGLTINNSLLAKKIIEGLTFLETSEEKTSEITIPVETSAPEITTEKVNDLGIKELIGRGSSIFRGSIPGRIHNIGLASSKFNGVLIPPGGTLSFNDTVGDVSSLTGYKQAYIIKDGRTVLGDGGGLCQVSTTLFRGALNSGLPIFERRAHSYRVGYYEQDSGPGIDATVFSPTTDFKFKNDTPGHILIQTIYNPQNSTLVFELYGTKDGRTATITKPVVTSSTAPPEDLYIDDPTLPTGTVKQVDYKAWGAKVNFGYKVERGGEILIDQKFYSNYRPWQSVFMRGTGPTQ